MPDIQAPAGVPITTSTTTIWENTSESGRNAVVEVTISNIDGTNDAVLNSCYFVDASPAAQTQVLPRLFEVAALDAVSFRKILEPGDSITATASAAGDLVATIDVFWEPA